MAESSQDFYNWVRSLFGSSGGASPAAVPQTAGGGGGALVPPGGGGGALVPPGGGGGLPAVPGGGGALVPSGGGALAVPAGGPPAVQQAEYVGQGAPQAMPAVPAVPGGMPRVPGGNPLLALAPLVLQALAQASRGGDTAENNPNIARFFATRANAAGGDGVGAGRPGASGSHAPMEPLVERGGYGPQGVSAPFVPPDTPAPEALPSARERRGEGSRVGTAGANAFSGKSAKKSDSGSTVDRRSTAPDAKKPAQVTKTLRDKMDRRDAEAAETKAEAPAPKREYEPGTRG